MRELSLHILDIVQNSLAAQASLVQITINENSEKNLFLIEIEDNGRGMSDEQVKRALDPFYTTRTTRRVGLGLPMLQANAQACGGDVFIESVPSLGTKVRAEFQLDHIDRPPLGDMVSTLVSLVAGSPQVDFVYIRRRDEKSFCFQTQELREHLQETPLNHPDVLSWIRDYLREKENTMGA